MFAVEKKKQDYAYVEHVCPMRYMWNGHNIDLINHIQFYNHKLSDRLRLVKVFNLVTWSCRIFLVNV